MLYSGEYSNLILVKKIDNQVMQSVLNIALHKFYERTGYTSDKLTIRFSSSIESDPFTNEIILEKVNPVRNTRLCILCGFALKKG